MIKFIEEIEEKEYEEFVVNHPNSHFLKSYKWGEVAKRRGMTPYRVGLKENNKLIATALLLKKSLPLGYSYFYIPRGYTIDYKDKKVLEQLTQEIKKFTKKHKSLYFRIDPDIMLHEIDEEAKKIENGKNNYELVKTLKQIGFKHKKLTKYFESMQPRYTFRVDLKTDMETVRKRYSKAVNRFVKVANKYGVEAHVGTKDNVEDFIRLMKLTEKRQNFYSHEYSFYHYFYDLFKEKDYVDILYADVDVQYVLNKINEDLEKIDSEKENNRYIKLQQMKKEFETFDKTKRQIVSCYFNVNYGNKSWYLYGANDMDYKLTYANFKLFDFQIEYAKEKGKDLLDEFGTIGDVHSKKSVIGLHEFKKKFGGEYTEFIGEFDYVTKPVMYFIFMKLIPLYTVPLKAIRHFKVRKQKVKRG